jgi:putative chitinase
MIEPRHLVGLAADPTRWLDPLNASATEFGIDTPERLAMFLAQAAHESQQFTRPRENLNYRAERLPQVWPSRFPRAEIARKYAHKPIELACFVYGGRGGNRPAPALDGWLYRGGGIFGLTFLNNYRAAGAALGIDLVAHPERIIESEISARAAGWFWRVNKLNRFADAEDLRGCTKAINGALEGLANRRRLYDIARSNFELSAQE